MIRERKMLAKEPKRLMLGVLRVAVFLALFPIVFSPGPGLAIETLAKQAYLMDMTTGAVLFEKNSEAKMSPASMSKMMTVSSPFTTRISLRSPLVADAVKP